MAARRSSKSSKSGKSPVRRPSPIQKDRARKAASQKPRRPPASGIAAPARGVIVHSRDAEGDEEDMKSGIRLQKFLATAGVDSRRNCEEYIRTGRVTVDGHAVIDPATSIDPESQDIRLDGERLRLPRFKYFLLNKPKGVLCTNSDPQGRPRAVDLIPSHGRRLFTVGRLDESTEGLLLITNDGDLAERLAHPRFEVVRRYRCQVAGIPSRETLQSLREGMYFSDGFFRFRGVRILKRKGRSVILELELREGKNREIRRLLAKVGHKVITLERIAFGPLRIGYLTPGKHRELRPSEVLELRRELDRMELVGSPDSNRRPRRKPKSAEVEAQATTAVSPAKKTASKSMVRGANSESRATVRTSHDRTPATGRKAGSGDPSSARPSRFESAPPRRAKKAGTRPATGKKGSTARSKAVKPSINKGRDRRRSK